jgi:DNA-binding NarL/FixJ family response regulator
MVRVLLADSQPLFNEALEALFSRDDVHQVVGRCSWAEDAFAHVSSLRPDLVLVDADLLQAAIRSGAAGVVGKTYGASAAVPASSSFP